MGEINFKNITTLIIVNILLFCVSVCYAGLVVEPTVIEQRLLAGETVSGTYKVSNVSDVTLKVVVEPENWLARLFGVVDDLEVKDWIKVEPSEFQLEPGMYTEVTYTMTAPNNFEDERVAQVFFEFSQTDKKEIFVTRLGVIAYMTPIEHAQIDAELGEAVFVYPVLDGKAALSYELTNTGNVHVRPDAVATIKEVGSDTVVAVFKMPPVMGVYPGRREKLYKNDVFSPLTDGEYTAELAVNIGAKYEQDYIIKKDIHFSVGESKE